MIIKYNFFFVKKTEKAEKDKNRIRKTNPNI